MTVTFQYMVYHPLTRQQLAPPLQLVGPQWSEIVNGIGEFSAVVPLPPTASARDNLKTALEPDQAAIYVRSSTGQYLFGGPLVEQSWASEDGSIAIKAVEWRSWLYDTFVGPKTDLSGNNLYSWAGKDQLLIAREIVQNVIDAGIVDGRIAIETPAATSGKNRDLNISGLDFKYAGEWIDSMAKRAGGFEWRIDSVPDTDGRPKLRLMLGYPELGSQASGLALFRTPEGGNISVSGSIIRSSVGRKSRIWATGNTETQQYAVDSDPGLKLSSSLLREKVTNYSTVVERTTLASNARAERNYLTPKLNTVNVLAQEKTLDVTAYHAGDRCRLRYSDELYDIDLASARIIERRVAPNDGAGKVDMVIDLEDFQLPESDAAGAV